jgi:hypothetical protein
MRSGRSSLASSSFVRNLTVVMIAHRRPPRDDYSPSCAAGEADDSLPHARPNSCGSAGIAGTGISLLPSAKIWTDATIGIQAGRVDAESRVLRVTSMVPSVPTRHAGRRQSRACELSD